MPIYRNNHCLLWGSYETNKYTLWATLGVFNVNAGGNHCALKGSSGASEELIVAKLFKSYDARYR
jgi:hypothetical protein